MGWKGLMADGDSVTESELQSDSHEQEGSPHTAKSLGEKCGSGDGGISKGKLIGGSNSSGDDFTESSIILALN